MRQEISSLGPLPPRISVETSEGDAFEKLSGILDDLHRDHVRIAPAFLFVDPYGFKIPARLLSELMKAGRVELFINVMWRELDMLIQQRPERGTGSANTLDEIFGSEAWRTEVVSPDVDERLYQATRLLAVGIRARWWTSAVQMVSGGQATRYVLFHLSNSPHGRDLMKECAWKIFPSGQFRVRKSDNPDQQVLFQPSPDLTPLRVWVITQLQHGPRKWQELHEAIRSEIWLEKHVNEIVRALKEEGVIDSDKIPAGRKFGAAANPRLWLRGSH